MGKEEGGKRMKILPIVATMPIIFLSSCHIIVTDEEVENAFSSLVGKIAEGDASSIKRLFSEHVREEVSDLEEDILSLIEFWNGDIVEITKGPRGDFKTLDNLEQQWLVDYNAWEVETTSHRYYFNILWCFIDDFDSENIGMMKLMVSLSPYGEDSPSLSGQEWLYGDSYRGITII